MILSCDRRVFETGLVKFKQTWLMKGEFIEVEVENIKVTIKLKITPAKRRSN